MPQLFIGGAILGVASLAGFKVLMSGVEDAGQALDSAGSGALKFALAAGGSYIILKKTKVI